MLPLSRRLTILCLCTITLVSCSETTAPSADTIRAERARWTAQGITNYTYIYKISGFFISYAGRDILLTVRNDSVVAAVAIATGEALSAAQFPTIDRLFDQAETALRAGTLARIDFDSQLGFPVRMDVTGPPDASGSIFAGVLTPAN